MQNITRDRHILIINTGAIVINRVFFRECYMCVMCYMPYMCMVLCYVILCVHLRGSNLKEPKRIESEET